MRQHSLSFDMGAETPGRGQGRADRRREAQRLNDDARKCPRCEAAVILFVENDDSSVSKLGALSRAARDHGGEVLVCPRCGERQALYGYDLRNRFPWRSGPSASTGHSRKSAR